MVLPNLWRSVMSELRFSLGQIEALAEKLALPQAQLSEDEKKLLLVIFAAARNQVWSSEDSGRADIRITDLRDQLLKAFIPDGGGSEFVIHADHIGPI
jgi:hypothetical protein